MKKGFTMIELIFVIVILGILAAVAIPRLAATRDDAEITKGLSEISMAVSDLTAYYTSRGEFSDTITDMTNVSLGGSVTTTADGVPSGTLTYSTKNQGSSVVCVNIEVVDASEKDEDDNTIKTKYALELAKADTATGPVCSGIVESTTFKDMAFTKEDGEYTSTSRQYIISGSNVKF